MDIGKRQPQIVSVNHSLEEAIARVCQNGSECVVVVDEEERYETTMTKQDLRMTILHGVSLHETISQIKQRGHLVHRPAAVKANGHSEDPYQLMSKLNVSIIPILDEQGWILDLIEQKVEPKKADLPVQALIMVGGFGLRLGQLTAKTPKPLLPIVDKPLLEITFEQLRKAGIRQVTLATHCMGERVQEFCGDGERFGLQIQCLHEKRPLGTAGALGLLPPQEQPILVLNGDILTRVDFRALLNFHQENQAAMTVLVKPKEIPIAFGVVETKGVILTSIKEKPSIFILINSGIYLLQPEVRKYVQPGQRLDMPDLIRKLLRDGKKVVSFPLLDEWIDIGQESDYQQAHEQYQRWQDNHYA